MRHIIFLTTSLIIISCGQNDTKQKELALKEKELSLRERELALDSLKNSKPNSKISSEQEQKSQTNNVPFLQLLKEDKTFNLPITKDKILSLLGKQTKKDCYEDEYTGSFCEYIWQYQNGLVLTGEIRNPSSRTIIESITLKSSNKNVIENCIYNLSLNKTTKSNCDQLFGNYFKKSTLELFDRITYKVFKNNLYTYLTFNSNNTLVSITQTTFDWEQAN